MHIFGPNMNKSYKPLIPALRFYSYKRIVHPKMRTLSCHSKPVQISFFCGTQNNIFWKMKVKGFGGVLDPTDFHFIVQNTLSK